MSRQSNETKPIKHICAGLLAHVDAGKTTLTEQLLAACGAIREAGDVDAGTALTDWLPVERRRGISVKTACARLEIGGTAVNLIDTPGHVDFAGEVERSLGALDGAVLVVSAVEGMQAHTVLLWEALRTMRLPALIVINKIDRVGSRSQEVLLQIRRELAGCLPLAMQRADGEGSVDCAVRARRLAEPDFREEALLAAAEATPSLEDTFLSGEPVPDAQLDAALTDAARAGRLTPVLLASAKQKVGIDELAGGIVRFLPPAPTDETGPLSGLVFAVDHDPVMGKGAHVRLFSGCLRNRDAAPVAPRDGDAGKVAMEAAPAAAEKITQIRRVAGAHAADIGRLRAGEIGVLYGLSGVRTGDVLGEDRRRAAPPLAVPLLMVQVYPESEEALPRLMEALRELADEDPLLQLTWVPEKRELTIRITGLIQLEILTEQLLDRYNLKARFSSPSVIYKETPTAPGVGYESYTMPKPCWAKVELRSSPGRGAAASPLPRPSRRAPCPAGTSITWKSACGRPSSREFTAGRSPMPLSPSSAGNTIPSTPIPSTFLWPPRWRCCGG